MNNFTKQTLGLADYSVCLITLLISTGIGVFFSFTGGKQKTNKEYLLADKKQPLFSVAVSLMASFISSITMLGIPPEFYARGTQFALIDLGYVLLAPVAAHLYIPVFFKLQATSAYEYLSRRFGHLARLMASCLFLVQMVLYMGVVLYAPAVALNALTTLSQNWSILVIGLVCTVYSTLGGMKAVIATDVFQALLMYAAIFLVIASASMRIGFGTIWRIAEERGRVQFFDFSFDPTTRHTFWSLSISGGMQFLSLYAVNQNQVQRYLSVKDVNTAIKALYLSTPIFCLLSLTTMFSGLAVFAVYKDCDPVKDGRIHSTDQLLPLYILETVGNWPGATGIFVSGIFSGALSTVSSLLNSLAAVTLEDFIKPGYYYIKKKPLEEAQNTVLLTKVLCFLYGLICLGIAFLAQYVESILQTTLTIFGAAGGPSLGIFTLGMFVPLANEFGAVSGLICGLAATLTLGFGGPKPPLVNLPVSVEGCASAITTPTTPVSIINFTTTIINNATTSITKEQHYNYLFRISYLWYIVIGFVVTMIVGTLVSLAVNMMTSDSKQLDPDLFTPPVAAYIKKHYCYQVSKSGTHMTRKYGKMKTMKTLKHGDTSAL
ncbi:putative sodium-dependent multivitamin transporter [Nilaparvata lugens]|uniref:putative sodium-dependent multivitamin transporter n=1 Tax=Nilaparvata lugens TaxID=108931 RepID=UPI00193E9034|nr:putative sodium-dependent multivitamin transporter [Nilaparvata lugens]XP_039279383.1 putative sodium-dependent multivitamin transporter [Nilaparvata lugens]XP_039279384.1 putative sodium-dependent multivitamin transporter [Nilaparvata lugens]